MNFKRCIKFAAYLIVVFGFSSAHAGAYEDFFRAVERDDARAVVGLLQRGFDPNARSPEGQVGLFLALRGGAHAAADALWGHPELDVNIVNEAGETPLMMAALRGNLAWTRKLLERGARLHQDGWSPVHYAATGPEPSVVRHLLDKGAPVDALSPNRTTPLMMAARYGNSASVELLLARGADPRRRNDRGASAADFAQMGGREALAQRLDRLTR